jgi:hypothetical protein
MIYIAVLAFALAILMHLFGWSHGVIDVTLFELIGLLCLALAGCTWGWLPIQRRGTAPPA